jgi:hypothetical protein
MLLQHCYCYVSMSMSMKTGTASYIIIIKYIRTLLPRPASTAAVLTLEVQRFTRHTKIAAVQEGKYGYPAFFLQKMAGPVQDACFRNDAEATRKQAVNV